MQQYEVEIKSLLGTSERADEVREMLTACDAKLIGRNKQLNHYFEGGTLSALESVVAARLSSEARDKLGDLVQRAKTYTVRTRDKDGSVFLVVKASTGENDSGVIDGGAASRMEFEEKVPMTIDELDALVLSAGFKYQAKWSREREEYICRGINVTLDKNAGYGWLAEFEMIVDDESKVRKAGHDIRNLMQILFVEILPQERLERMFEYYNKNWQEYYGTDKVFTIE